MPKAATQKTKQDKNANKLSRAYDEVPYSSYPFAQTSPELLQGIAHIFGLKTPDVATARILEIGCASGNNIMSIASRYPKSKCTGFDYAARQIEAGQKTLKESGIKNLELKHLSVMDVTKDFGEFDYIICHGVLSWVPPEVQQKIVEVCSTNLSRDGVAYISYNTLPGWNAVRSAREMMLYHTQQYETPAEKAVAARQILKFVGDAMRQNNNHGAVTMDRELEILSQQPDYYLLHEHLEENNYQFYFHDFMKIAEKNGLQYLAETSLEKMYSGNFSEEISNVLATSTDIVRTEQYMDFIYDRRFRSTLLCHKDRILTRNIQPETVKDGYLLNRFSFPANFMNFTIGTKQMLEFRAQTGMTLNSDDAVIHAFMQTLMEAGMLPLAVSKLVSGTQEKLKKAGHPAAQNPGLEPAIYQFVMRYMFIGALYFYTASAPYTGTVSQKPLASQLSRYQAHTQEWLANQRQEHIASSPLDHKLIPLLDGKHDIAAMCKELMPCFHNGELTLNESGTAITDMKLIEQRLPEFVVSALKNYAALAVLVG